VSQVVAIEDEVGMRNGQLVWYGQRSFVSSDMKFKKEEGDGTRNMKFKKEEGDGTS
jgi:hypothetical protein